MERIQYLVPIVGNTRNNFVDVSPTAPFPVQVITGSLATGAATEAKQDELQGVQGTGASYNPPTGGSGLFGWLSGIFKEIKGGIPLLNGGTAVSSSNPLPTKLTAVTSSSQANYDGVMYSAYTIVSAVSGKYSAAQLHNPTGSGKTLLVYSCTAYTISTAGLIYRSHPSSALATVVSGITNNKTGAGNSVAILSKGNLDAVSDTTYPPINVVSATPPGSVLSYSGAFYTITEGESLQFTHSVANCGMGIVFVYAEIPN